MTLTGSAERADLRLDQDKIDEHDNEVMFNIFVGEALASRALSKAHTFPEGTVICLAVGRIKMRDRRCASDANWHAWRG